jgi:hypothetical protein
MISFATALASLTKGAAWSMVEDDYENIDWYSQEIEKPTREAVLIEQERLQKIEDSNAYKAKRACRISIYRRSTRRLMESWRSDAD